MVTRRPGLRLGLSSQHLAKECGLAASHGPSTAAPWVYWVLLTIFSQGKDSGIACLSPCAAYSKPLANTVSGVEVHSPGTWT